MMVWHSDGCTGTFKMPKRGPVLDFFLRDRKFCDPNRYKGVVMKQMAQKNGYSLVPRSIILIKSTNANIW